MPSDAFRRLDEVARALPFPLDDTDAANAVFVQWRDAGGVQDRHTLDLWAYCFVQRYFLKRVGSERGSASEFDAIVGRTFERIHAKLSAGEVTTDRFASYVAVACKNALRNHRRDRRPTSELEEWTATTDAEAARDYDGALARRALGGAIAKLPGSVRTVAQLHFLDGHAYDAVATQTGIAIDTVRTYAARARSRLREDPDIRALYYDDVLPPAASDADP